MAVLSLRGTLLWIIELGKSREVKMLVAWSSSVIEFCNSATIEENYFFGFYFITQKKKLFIFLFIQISETGKPSNKANYNKCIKLYGVPYNTVLGIDLQA